MQAYMFLLLIVVRDSKDVVIVVSNDLHVTDLYTLSGPLIVSYRTSLF